MSVDLASVDDVPARGVAAVALERLESANLSAEIAGLRSIAFDGIETAVVAIPMTAPTSTLRRVAETLAGLAHQCVLVDQPAVRASDERTAVKDGRTWRIGTQSDVAWIQDDTLAGMSINAALPPVFEAYATVVIPDADADRKAGDSALLQLLAEQTATQPWWLGYLDTGVHDTVFDRVWKVMLYTGWSYVLVEAGPTEAGTWRADDPWRGRLPDLVFPADHSWLVSMLWDDDWRCLGGPAALIRAVTAHPALDSNDVHIGEDATPPGHVAR